MRKFLLCVIVALPVFVSAQLKINEIMTNNVSAVWDDAYNRSMWVELYNSSTATSINQSAFYFTDNLTQPRKWAPPYNLISPQGYSILWFENSTRTGHANFKLDPDGGTLYMLNASAQVIDSIKYPKQFRNISYGRKTDGGNEWVYFEQFSNGATNTGKKYAAERCANPVFNLPGGFYNGTKNASFATPAIGDTIYYTVNGAEPTRTNARYVPGYVITMTSTTILRAKTFSAGKLSSDVVTTTYFINERDFNLPVVSIVTEQANLTDNTIGIYVQGTNGLTGNGMTTPANWNQDWDRPANFELFDTTHVSKLNQELNISIAGGWTRMNGQKSLKINPSKKFGENKLDYDIFAATKPNMKYKSILYRNSGNDFRYSMMRDGFMQSLVMKRMNLDYIAYEPSVCFMNGVYYGIQNLRERSDVDFIYSNYGLEEEDIRVVESAEMGSDTSFLNMSNYIKNNDITTSTVYNKACQLIDMDNFMDYFLTEIFLRNTDWPHNNIKAWKKKTDGKWRWILYDTDFGYNLWSNDHTHNTLTWALGEQSNTDPANTIWSTILLKRLVLNESFKKKFIDRFCIQASSTFEYNRSCSILDSLALKISNEITYHKAKWGSDRTLASDVSIMKGFALNRPTSMLGFISNRFLGGVGTQTISISSNNAKASYKFNDEKIIDAAINLKYFSGQTFKLTANAIPGFRFKQWELNGGSSSLTLIENGSNWKYYDGASIPASNWFNKTFNETGWSSGNAQLGYGGKGEVTTIGYGGNSSAKYTTAYFRKSFTVNNLSSKSNFTISTFFDDGIAVYVNGIEVGRNNLPTGTLAFSTLASTSNNGITATFTIPQNLLIEGENVIAVEVHQINATSSDLIFNLQLTCSSTAIAEIVTTPTYTATVNSGVSIKAVYEQTIFEDPDRDINLVINEVVSSNNFVQDEFGGNEDYIELYNNGNEDVNIAGWYISDTPTNPTLYQIPSTDSLKTIVPAKGRIVLWADNETTQGILHLGFKLSKDGEKIVLSKTNYLGAVILRDSVTFPYMDQNMSYSRIPDGSSTWKVVTSTCNMANADYTGFEDQKTEIRIYPTMVEDHLTIENANQKVIRIYDLAGNMILQKLCDGDRELIQLDNLTRGVYIVALENSKFKFIKL